MLKSTEDEIDFPLVPAEPEALDNLKRLHHSASDYLQQSKAPNTIRAYRADWNDFTAWCTAHGRPSLPAEPETVCLYLAARAETHKPSTLSRRLTTLGQAHRAADLANPADHSAVRAVWQGIRRAKGTAQARKAPAVTSELKRMLLALEDVNPYNQPKLLRDRALLLVGFAAALRRSELIGLDVADVEFHDEGLTLTLHRSKTDQEGAGRRVGIPFGSRAATCPVRTLKHWLEKSEISEGPIYRGINQWGRIASRRLSAQSVALVVKEAAEAAGLDPAKYAGHSLRAGLATSAAQAGVSERAIMNQTGHTNVTTVRKYIREGSLFRENAAAEVGL